MTAQPDAPAPERDGSDTLLPILARRHDPS